MEAVALSTEGACVIPTVTGKLLTFSYTIVTTAEQLEGVRRLKHAPLVAFDTETSGLKVSLGARAIGYCLAALSAPDVITAYYIPVRHTNDESLPQLPIEVVVPVVQEVLDGISPTDRAVLHHAKFDLAMARADGIFIRRKIRDTVILATADNENETGFGLKRLASKYSCVDAEAEEKQLDAWMKKDARILKFSYKKRSKNKPDEPTYLERFGYARTPITLCGFYGAKDVFYTLHLYTDKYAKVEYEYPAVVEREHGVMHILHEMEWTGLPADRQEILRAHAACVEDLAYWVGESTRLANIMLDETVPPQAPIETIELSPEFLKELFYQRFGLEPPKQTKTGADSTDREARQLLAHRYPEFAPLIKAVDRAARVEKLVSTYTDAFLRHWSETTERIHPSYNQVERRDEGGVPVTGRLSSGDPNIQNCAKKPVHLRRCSCAACVAEKLGKQAKDLDEAEKLLIGPADTISVRRYFTVPKGFVRLLFDFSQIELRVLAWFSRDPRLLECYANDLDVHAITAAEVTDDDREIAKQVNFGNNYGMTEVGLAKRISGYYADPEGTRVLARQILRRYFIVYAGVPRFRLEFARDMRAHGNMFVNPFGRPRRLPEIGAFEQWKRERAERRMMSSIISGTAADLLKECMLRCDALLRARSPESKMVQSIHDELVFDLRATAGWASLAVDIKRTMEDWPMFSDRGVPIRVACKLATVDWEHLRELKITPDGSLQLGE